MRRLAGLLLLAATAAADDLELRYGPLEVDVDGPHVDVAVAWDGSWLEGERRDGAWIFVKLGSRRGGWRTGRLDAAQVLEGDVVATPSRDGAGVFVSRSLEGGGPAAGVLRLTFGDADGGGDLRVHGVEMVRVAPEGAPAFWVCKDELDQGAYAAFLDTIPTQATFTRSPLGGRSYGGLRGTIQRRGSHYVAERPRVEAGYLAWDDGCAWADWAGLRPARTVELEAAAGQVRRLDTGLWEPAVADDSFRATHGDGELTRSGAATNRDWPPAGRGLAWRGVAGPPPSHAFSDRRADVGFRAARTAPGVRRVLLVGTDASTAGGLPETLAALTRTAGVPRPAEVTVRARAGDRFERMAASQSLLDELASGRFDVVVLQEDVARLGGARRASTHARPLVEAARRGGALPVLVMTWGLPDRPSIAVETAAANVHAWAEELGARVAPMGLAWRRARSAVPAAALLEEDGSTPSAAGAWLNACVLYQLLYGDLPVTAAELPGPVELARLAGEVVRGYVQPR